MGVESFHCSVSNTEYVPSRPADFPFPYLYTHDEKFLCVKVITVYTKIKDFIIPFGNWESMSWYEHAIAEYIGYPIGTFRIVLSMQSWPFAKRNTRFEI